MRSKQWRGTILFAVVLTVLGATAGLRLYGIGEDAAATPAAASPAAATAPAASGSTESGSAGSGSSAGTSSDSSDSSASTATRTIDGDAVQTRYGAMQVQVVLDGSTITAVNVLQYPDRDGRDVQINQQALPLLEQEVLQSQSASIDTVSGATYTSEGYIQSLQSALDKE
jgi:uncharacterized protein with FMN-binding domain